MAKRKVIKINGEKCNGCASCIPNCPEGAIQIIDKKAHLVSDLFCDGLGVCLGHCPQGAITIEEREAEPYDERKVMENIIKLGRNVIKAHLEHLKGHSQARYLKQAIDFLKEKNIEIPLEEALSANGGHSGCPGSKVMDLRKEKELLRGGKKSAVAIKQESQLRNWPVQITLVPEAAPYLEGADLLIAADCVSFAYADFHRDLLKGKILLVGCPKLDNAETYRQKISQILKQNNIRSIAYAHMEVPCCFGLLPIIKSAIADSAKEVPFEEITISIKGKRLG